MNKKAQINGWYIVAAVLAVLAIQQWWIERQQVETIPYSQFEEMIDAGKIQSVRVTDKYVTGTLKETPPDGRKRFVTVRVEPALAKRLAERGITVEGRSRTISFATFYRGSSLPWCSSAYGPSSSVASPKSRAWAD